MALAFGRFYAPILTTTIITTTANPAGATMPYLTVSEAARRIGAMPRDISGLFYDRTLRDDIAPIKSGRRLIPEDYLDTIRAALRRAGKSVDDIGAPAPNS